MTLHPMLVLLLTAALVGVTRRRVRQGVLVAGTLTAVVVVVSLGPADHWSYEVSTYRLDLLHVDRLSQLFGLIFSLAALIGVIYALHSRRGGEHAATLVYAGGALGVVYAGDWISAFVCWELMGVASLVVVWYGGGARAQAAGLRYMFVHVTGGSLLFAGIVLRLAAGGTGTLGAIGPLGDHGLAYGLILAGIAINAAVPPLHAWLTDAYPEASVTGTVFLSAFTTKTAVYLLIRVFPGAGVLVWAGAIMAVYGAVFAVLENDIRRLLAYHIVSQVGYMVAGVGIGSALAVNGAAAHAFSHILYKALLLMGAGAVLHTTGRRKLTDLGGIWRSMPLVVICYGIGACSISGVPWFNGFVSKSMVIGAATGTGRPAVELLLTLASVGTFLHTGLKLPYFTFFGPDRGLQPAQVPRNMLVAMVLASACCIGIGVFPRWLYDRLPVPPVVYEPYTADHVVSALQLLLGTAAGFWLLRGKLGGEPTVTLDTDRLWRTPVRVAVAGLVSLTGAAGDSLQAAGRRLLTGASPYLFNPFLILIRLGLGPAGGEPPRMPDRTRSGDARPPAYDADGYRLPIGVTIFWITASLAVLTVLIWMTTATPGR